MVELQLPKLIARVRFPSLAPMLAIAESRILSAHTPAYGLRKCPQPSGVHEPRDVDRAISRDFHVNAIRMRCRVETLVPASQVHEPLIGRTHECASRFRHLLSIRSVYEKIGCRDQPTMAGRTASQILLGVSSKSNDTQVMNPRELRQLSHCVCLVEGLASKKSQPFHASTHRALDYRLDSLRTSSLPRKQLGVDAPDATDAAPLYPYSRPQTRTFRSSSMQNPCHLYLRHRSRRRPVPGRRGSAAGGGVGAAAPSCMRSLKPI
jgi:hypothetical protein